jgi:hypothetical protein
MAIILKITRKELTLAKRLRLWILYYKGYIPTQILAKTKILYTTITLFI